MDSQNNAAKRTNRKGARLVLLLMLAALLAPLAAAPMLQAQPNLNFKRMTINWPTVELYFSVGCSGAPAYNMTKQDFRIFENGAEVKDFTLWCPNPTIRCAISVSLVFDASGSMSGSSNTGAKQAGHAFIDLMDGVVDEAAIIFFSSTVWTEQQMTTIKPMLHSAVDALPVSNMTAVWDGIYSGIIELINNGVNQSRSVVVVTDGGDNSSTRTVAEIIALANRHRIRVFTVGLGTGINATELEMIALLTGGRYYQTPNAGQLSAIYQEIATILFQCFQECSITYERDCADGALRTVELQLNNFCGGTDTKTKTYRAPLDSTTFSNLNMEIGDALVEADSDIRVPLNLLTPISDTMFYPFSFTLLYDAQCMQFKSVQTPPGSLLAGLPMTVTPTAGGAKISITDRSLLTGSGMMMEFTFHSSDSADTTCCTVTATDAKFEQGCFIPVIDAGDVCILPRIPVVACDIDAPPRLTWQRGIKDYLPNPFPVKMRIVNTGKREATNVRFKIVFDSSDVQLVSPLSDMQNGTPADLLAGEYSEATWQVAAKRRTSSDATQFCITASFDNHEDVTCCISTHIPATEPILECEIDAPMIVADNGNARYVPMPFPVTVTVNNTGGQRTDSVFATIYLTPDLTLATGENPTKRLLPSRLNSNQQGQAQWMLRHPPTTVEKRYVIQVWVRTANTDSSMCEKTIIIPPMDTPILAPRCYVPDSLHFDEAADSYIPNPFTVRLTCVNNGNTVANNVTGTLILPPGMVLVSPVEPLSKPFTPSTMNAWQIGDPVPELIWIVQWTRRDYFDRMPEFLFSVTGENFNGIHLDTTTIGCTTRVPGLVPVFTCDLTIPDSLRLNAIINDVEPNPFPVLCTVTNQSTATQNLSRVLLDFPPGELQVFATSPLPALVQLDTLLAPGQHVTLQWLLQALPSTTARNSMISVLSFADTMQVSSCEDMLPIAALPVAELEVSCSGPDTLHFDAQSRLWTPNPFQIQLSMKNGGATALNSLTASAIFGSGFNLASGETVIKTVAPDTLLPGDTALPLTWLMHLVPRASCRDTTENICIRISGRMPGGGSMLPITCCIPIFIQASGLQKLSISVQGSTTLCEGDSVLLEVIPGFED
ncbi:MAG: VWA domain-containing protein, partial [Bacteroidota bacterium]